MSFIKYFREEKHMERFIEGYVRFVSLASYRHSENEGRSKVLGDSDEGRINLDLSKAGLALKITAKQQVDAKEDVQCVVTPETLNITFEAKDYGNTWIFCVAKQETEKFKADEYKYFVEFDEISFNKNFDDFIKNYTRESLTNKEARQKVIRSFTFENAHYCLYPALQFHGQDGQNWVAHGDVNYYDNILKEYGNPVFNKRKIFSDEFEYRYAVYLDLFKVLNPSNAREEFQQREKLLLKGDLVTDPSSIPVLMKLAFELRIDKFKIIHQGLIP